MSIHKALHPRNEVDRLYVQEKQEEEDTPFLKIALMGRCNELDNAQKRGGMLITETRNYTKLGLTEQK